MRRKDSDKKKLEKAAKREEKLLGKRRCSTDKGRESGSDSADSRDLRHRSSSDQTVTQERLKVPEESVRRLSSPEIDACGVITASLKIPVPLQQANIPSSLAKEPDIPYIEDTILAEEARTRRREGSVTSRPRTGSSDSYLGQPITGTMSFQPLCKKDNEKQSHDSVLSSSSADFLTLSPSPRNTPVSDVMCASEASSPMSRATSPPVVLSPDSGTPGLSPPPSPPPPLLPRRARRVEQTYSKSTPLAHSATHTFGTKAHVYSTSSARGTRDRGAPSGGVAPITRSRTAEVPASSAVPANDPAPSILGAGGIGGARQNVISSGVKVDVYNITGGLSKVPSTGDVLSSESGDGRRYTRRRNTKPKESPSTPLQHQILPQKVSSPATQQQQTQAHPQTPIQQFSVSQKSSASSLQPQPRPLPASEPSGTPQLWKRCEIIASDPTDPKARL